MQGWKFNNHQLDPPSVNNGGRVKRGRAQMKVTGARLNELFFEKTFKKENNDNLWLKFILSFYIIQPRKHAYP